MGTYFEIDTVSEFETDNDGSFEVTGIEYFGSGQNDDFSLDIWRFYITIAETGLQSWINIFWHSDIDVWENTYCEMDILLPNSLASNILRQIIKNHPTPYEALDVLPTFDLLIDFDEGIVPEADRPQSSEKSCTYVNA